MFDVRVSGWPETVSTVKLQNYYATKLQILFVGRLRLLHRERKSRYLDDPCEVVLYCRPEILLIYYLDAYHNLLKYLPIVQ